MSEGMMLAWLPAVVGECAVVDLLRDRRCTCYSTPPALVSAGLRT